MAAGMPGFDAVCNSLATLATGGFSNHPDSIMGYNSNAINWITIVFMFLGGSSFTLLYSVWRKKSLAEFFRNEEFRVYFGIIAVAALLITLCTGSFMHSVYQVVSVFTVGNISVDFETWNFTARMLLFALMFVGACSTSAGGGIKVMRWIIIFKTMQAELKQILHPNAVINIRINDRTVPKDVIAQTVMFVCFYFAVFAVSTILIGILEQNGTVALAGSISTLGNIGLGFGTFGPTESFAVLHPLTKVIMIVNMLVGRLELIPFLVFFHRD